MEHLAAKEPKEINGGLNNKTPLALQAIMSQLDHCRLPFVFS